MNDGQPTKGNNASNRQGHSGFKLGFRHVECFIIFIGVALAYAMRVNLSMAIVAMTDKDNADPKFGAFGWSEQIKSVVLSSFFWGYVITQIPAGYLSQKFGSKGLLIASFSVCSVLNVLTPICAKYGDWPVVVGLRVVEGLSQGLIFPSVHTVISQWAPISERSVLTTCIYSGTQFGTVIMLASSGVLAASPLGWPSIFYVPGGISMIWVIVWIVWGASVPEKCKYLSPEELNFIMSSQGGDVKHNKTLTGKIPWLEFFTSPPFLVLISVHCSYSWTYWTLLTQIPTYMRFILGMNIKSNALLSALPYLAMFLMCYVCAAIGAELQRRKYFSLNVRRKLFNSIGMGVPAITLIALAFSHDVTVAVSLLTITVGIGAGIYLGFLPNHIDLSPNYAGILMGITNCAANCTSIIAPLAVGQIVTNERNASLWRIVFFVSAGVCFGGNLLFVLFGQTTTQSWNDQNPN